MILLLIRSRIILNFKKNSVCIRSSDFVAVLLQQSTKQWSEHTKNRSNQGNICSINAQHPFLIDRIGFSKRADTNSSNKNVSSAYFHMIVSRNFNFRWNSGNLPPSNIKHLRCAEPAQRRQVLSKVSHFKLPNHKRKQTQLLFFLKEHEKHRPCP